MSKCDARGIKAGETKLTAFSLKKIVNVSGSKHIHIYFDLML